MLKGFKESMLKGDLIRPSTRASTTAKVARAITKADRDRDRGSAFHYGAVIDALLTFVATAAAAYFFVIVPYKTYQDAKGVSAKTRPCPECTSSISVAAKRCPNCTATVLPDPPS